MATDKPMNTLRTSVPPDVFDKIEALAINGATPASVTRGILTRWAAASPEDAALAWIVRNRLVVPESVPNQRAKILAWAQSQGFTA